MPFFTPLSIVSIGSIPFVKGKNACEEIFKNWDIPFWPQYPGRSLRENFVFQFLSHFPGLDVSPSAASFNESEYRRKEKKYREKLKRALLNHETVLNFEPPSDWALGYSQMKKLLSRKTSSKRKIIKLQVTGPGTVWNSFFKKRVSRSLSPKVEKTLTMSLIARGLAQIHRVLSHQKTPLIFIDEPMRAENLSGLKKMVATFKKSGAVVGLHVCSNPDWRDFSGLNLDLFHFDSTAHDKFTEAQCRFIRHHLKKRKWIAWGAVSTLERNKNSREKLLKLIDQTADSCLNWKGILNRSLLAPACGTGGLKPEQDRAIFEDLRILAKELRMQGKKI